MINQSQSLNATSFGSPYKSPLDLTSSLPPSPPAPPFYPSISYPRFPNLRLQIVSTHFKFDFSKVLKPIADAFSKLGMSQNLTLPSILKDRYLSLPPHSLFQRLWVFGATMSVATPPKRTSSGTDISSSPPMHRRAMLADVQSLQKLLDNGSLLAFFRRDQEGNTMAHGASLSVLTWLNSQRIGKPSEERQVFACLVNPFAVESLQAQGIRERSGQDFKWIYNNQGETPLHVALKKALKKLDVEGKAFHEVKQTLLNLDPEKGEVNEFVTFYANMLEEMREFPKKTLEDIKTKDGASLEDYLKIQYDQLTASKVQFTLGE